jgi:hypothetical protein
MTDLKQAAQQALEALNLPTMKTQAMLLQRDEAITALREALEQPEQGPVAWMRKLFSPELGEFFDYKDGSFAKETDSDGWTPLYTTPPAAQWDKPSASFDEWWDSNVMPSANPFVEGTAAYWAWSGWKAAQPDQVVDCPRCGHVCSQREWVGLTDEEANLLWENTDDRDSWELIKRVEAKLKERNT